GNAVPLPIPTGYWRAVYNNQCAFINESFMDEIAVAGGKDPLELRLSLLTDDKRIEVLQIAAEKAGWGTPLPAGWGRGIVQFSTWDASHLALVAEVSVAGDGSVRVQRVVCAANCGRVVNPSIVEAQIEGGIVFALSAALYGEITLEHGRVQQGNFSDYPVLRMNEMPLIEIHLVEATNSPSGMGEMAGPPTFAAVTNAVFAATGQRIRRLPIRKVSL
ncbi:MAG: xanthine dehydrogenase family protein molybdopterin-binding subunit, partial [Chloroflexi bacterium]|nr:xanthine dehydrogenase family protein molybdopterin-binding subunit [Chloroflexota bacterium]